MRLSVHKAMALCQPVMIVLWIGSFVLLAGFIPPPSPSASADEIVRMLQDDRLGFQIGLVITMFASALLVPFAAVLAAQMRRIEGPGAPLAMTQLCSAALLSLEFIIPIIVWQTAVYRADVESAELVRTLNDLGWLLFVSVISSVVVQIAAVGLAILTDEREDPIFPRWAAWLNIWVAFVLAPAGVVVFFHSGPFAWNGLISFYLPLTAYLMWSVVMYVLVRRAIVREHAESFVIRDDEVLPVTDPVLAR